MKNGWKYLAKTIYERGDAIGWGLPALAGIQKQRLHTLFYITGDSRKKGANMKNTQHYKILDFFKTHKYITPMDAFRHLGITKLATRISEMKRMGYLFAQEMIETVNRDLETVRVMRYEFVGRIDNGEFVPAKEVLERLAA